MKNFGQLSRSQAFFRIYGMLILFWIAAFILGAIVPLTMSMKDTMIPPVLVLLFPAPYIFYIYYMLRLRWMWVSGHALHAQEELPIELYFKLFKISIILPAIVLTLLILLVIFVMLKEGLIAMLGGTMGIPFLLLIPFSGLLYSCFFIAKTLKNKELGREALVTDYLGSFMLCFFLVIGIWNLQPRIRAIID